MNYLSLTKRLRQARERNIEKRSFFENDRGVRLGLGPPHITHSTDNIYRI